MTEDHSTETKFRVNRSLAALIDVVRGTVEATYKESGQPHGSPTFVGLDLSGLHGVYYHGDGEGIDEWRETTFRDSLGLGEGEFVALCFFSEAWTMVRDGGGPAPTSLADRPDRQEALVYEARDMAGNVAKARQLVTRDESGLPSFGELTFINPGRSGYLPSVSE